MERGAETVTDAVLLFVSFCTTLMFAAEIPWPTDCPRALDIQVPEIARKAIEAILASLATDTGAGRPAVCRLGKLTNRSACSSTNATGSRLLDQPEELRAQHTIRYYVLVPHNPHRIQDRL